MTHAYTVEGITCDGCVAKVKSKLLMHPDIQSVDLSLNDKKAVIVMGKHITLPELQQTIGVDTKYRISEDTADHSHHAMTQEQDKSWLATYRPLLLIAGFITLVAALTANGNLDAGMNNFMTGFFLVFSFFKLLDVRGFAESYSMYDLLAARLPAYGFVYPFIELGLGVAYLTGFNPTLTNWATVLIMGFSSIGVIRSLMSNTKIRCACLGAVFELPMSTVTIIEDLLMVAMAAYMIATH
jgi:cation transport ATPase